VHETVELRELRVFLTLAEELHFGRTAERLGLTQSRVSQSLRTLEHKLGEQLVHRTSRRVALTAAGERLLAEVGPAVASLADALERAGHRHLEGTVRIGLMFPNAGGARLVEIVDAFESAHPRCAVQVEATPPDDPGRPFREGEIDVLATPVLRDPPGAIVAATLDTEPRMLAVASNHPLARKKEVCVEDLGGYKVVAPRILPDDHQEAWVPLHTPSGRRIERLAQRPRSYDELALVVARGRAVHPTVTSTGSHLGSPSIVLVPISDLPPLRVVLMTRREEWNPRLREFVRIAREVARQRAASVSASRV
jgi:DNA-binding transcriptional LysR family regulator